MIEFNGVLLAIQVKLLRRWLGMRQPSICVSMPTMAPAAERLSWTKVVFDRCDDFKTLPESDAKVIDDRDLARRRRASVADGDWNKVANAMAQMLACPEV